jgi:hypothetical protein
VQLASGKFDSNIKRFPMAGELLRLGDRWPIGLSIDSGSYFVLAQGANFSGGSVYRLNQVGVIEDVFSRESGDDYAALASFQGEVWVANYAKLSIKRYSKYGALLGEFDAPEWESARAPLLREMLFYKRWEKMYSLLFWVSLVLGFAIAIWLEHRHKQALLAPQERLDIIPVNAHFSPSPTDSRIQWLEYSFYFKNIHKWLIWFWSPWLLFLIPQLYSAEEESVASASVLLLIHGVVLLLLFDAQRLTNKRLGALVPWVFIRLGANRSVYAHERELLSYSLFNRVVLMLAGEEILVGRGAKARLFKGDLANEYIARLLEKAQPISLVARLQWQLEHKFAALLWRLLLGLLYFIALVVVNINL